MADKPIVLEISPTERIIATFDNRTLIGYVHEKDGSYERRRGRLRKVVRAKSDAVYSFIPEELTNANPDAVVAFFTEQRDRIKGKK